MVSYFKQVINYIIELPFSPTIYYTVIEEIKVSHASEICIIFSVWIL